MTDDGGRGEVSRRSTPVAARLPWPWIALPVLLALLFYRPALGGGFLSDDYLLNAFTVRGVEEVVVDWSRIAADFGRPWLGLESAFYRPLLGVSLGVDLSVGGGSPVPFHVTNLLLHLVVVALTGVCCALYCPSRPALGAVLGGLVCALHPVAVEPVAWIAARNSELEVTFRTLALAAFAWHLRRGGAKAYGLSLAAAIAALMSKESAVVLPLSLLALDVLDAPRRRLRDRVRLHLPFVPLWLGYLVLRLLLFGSLVGAGATMGPAGPAALVANFGSKLAALFAPAALGAGPTWAAAAIGALWVVALAGGLTARGRLVFALGAAWVCAHALPTFGLIVGEGLGGSRMVYGALPPLALVAVRLLNAGEHSARWPMRAGRLLCAAGIVGLGATAHARLGDYSHSWELAARAERGLAEAAPRATPERPLALLAMPHLPPGVPPLNPNGWFAMGERPVQERDVPTVSLGFLTVPVPRSEELFHDASAAHALWQHGSALLAWTADGFRVRQRTADGADELPALEPAAGATGRFLFGGDGSGVSGDRIESVTLEVAGPITGGRLTVWTGAELPPELGEMEFGPGEFDGERTRVAIDLSHAIVLPSLATLRVPVPVRGFEVELGGDRRGRPLTITASSRVPELPLNDRLDGARLSPEELEERLTAPTVATPGASLRLVLLAPHSGLPVAAEPGRPVRLPGSVRAEMRTIAGLARQDRYLYYFEARTPPGQGGFGRTAVDWFTLAPSR